MVTGSRLTGYIVNVMRSPVNERLMVRGSKVALKHVIHDMEARTLVMNLRRRAIKIWVPCGDMDRRLKIPHPAKAECGFRTTPEECLYDSGLIEPSVLGLIIQYNTIQYNLRQAHYRRANFFLNKDLLKMLSVLATLMLCGGQLGNYAVKRIQITFDI